MKVKFKGVEKEFTAAYVTEQKIYKQGEPSGWLLAINIADNVSAQEIDSIITDDSIAEITCISEDEKMLASNTVTGYEKVTSFVVRYTDAKTTVDIQLTKGV